MSDLGDMMAYAIGIYVVWVVIIAVLLGAALFGLGYWMAT